MSNVNLMLAISGTLKPVSSAGATVVQQASSDNGASGAQVAVLPSAPTVGNVLVALATSGGYAALGASPGWTLVASGGGTPALGYWCGLFTRTVQSGDTATCTPTTTTSYVTGCSVWEVSGSSSYTLAGSQKITSGTGTLTGSGGSAPASSSLALETVFFNSSSPTATFGWSSGWNGTGPIQLTGFPYYNSGSAWFGPTTAAVAGPVVTWTGTRGNSQPCVCALAYVS